MIFETASGTNDLVRAFSSGKTSKGVGSWRNSRKREGLGKDVVPVSSEADWENGEALEPKSHFRVTLH